MDGDQFDALTRAFGSGRSRRGVLKALAGASLGAVAVGFDETSAAARKRAQGIVCSKNADCQSGACLPKDHTGRRYCAECGSPATCPPVSDACHVATCLGGSCGTMPTNLNGVCAPAVDACHTASTCDAGGHCVAGGAITCPGGDQCNAATCDSSTGCHVTPLTGGTCTTSGGVAGTCDAEGICQTASIVCPPNLVCGVTQAPCGQDTTGVCSSVRSVEATSCICGNDACGPACSTDADCQSYAPGAICQASGTGCCGQICIAPCGGLASAQQERTSSTTSSIRSNSGG